MKEAAFDFVHNIFNISKLACDVHLTISNYLPLSSLVSFGHADATLLYESAIF